MNAEIEKLKEEILSLKVENANLKKWKEIHQRDVDFLEKNSVIDLCLTLAKAFLFQKALEDVKEIEQYVIRFRSDLGYLDVLCVEIQNRLRPILKRISEVLGDIRKEALNEL